MRNRRMCRSGLLARSRISAKLQDTRDRSALPPAAVAGIRNQHRRLVCQGRIMSCDSNDTMGAGQC